MADFFGDTSLFEEFDKDREAEGSFIHYDADSIRSRIIFEGYDSDSDTESEKDENEATSQLGLEKEAPAAASATATPTPTPTPTEQKDSETEQQEHDKGECDKDNERRNTDTVKSQNGDDSAIESRLSINENQGTTSSNSKDTETEERRGVSSWLNDQLYASKTRGEDAEKANVRQLTFEKNKFRRYAKILDSTRYVPDDDSPAVQLLFNNNSFARRYRQQIEQFIKGLLWDELHSTDNSNSIPEVDCKPGAPSCVDINEALSPDKRTEHMRQKHTILGNSQFHKQFLIDFLGWPFSTKEPNRCNQNWEIPLYGQVFDEVYADANTAGDKKKPKKPKQSCWNCSQENHSMAECKMPRNPATIAANRKVFMENRPQRTEPKFTGPNRYHLDPEIASKFAKFSPGTISVSLREAMGITSSQLPLHIYKMRLYGYPPGWLAKAKQQESGVTIFDKTGRVTLITGECLEDGELDEEAANKNEFDVTKIVEYPGFTVPVPLGVKDEHEDHQLPPIQQHQLKETLIGQSPGRSRKRKHTKDQREKKKEEEASKKAKGSPETEEEDGEIPDESELESTQPLEDSVSSDNKASTSDAEKTPLFNRSSSTISLSRDFGTPILVREKSDLPDASKFSVGIEDHINFENLPNSTGTFEKMRNLIDIIRKKSKN